LVKKNHLKDKEKVLALANISGSFKLLFDLGRTVDDLHRLNYNI
jgi:hypothetical protein